MKSCWQGQPPQFRASSCSPWLGCSSARVRFGGNPAFQKNEHGVLKTFLTSHFTARFIFVVWNVLILYFTLERLVFHVKCAEHRRAQHRGDRSRQAVNWSLCATNQYRAQWSSLQIEYETSRVYTFLDAEWLLATSEKPTNTSCLQSKISLFSAERVGLQRPITIMRQPAVYAFQRLQTVKRVVYHLWSWDRLLFKILPRVVFGCINANVYNWSTTVWRFSKQTHFVFWAETPLVGGFQRCWGEIME